MCTALAPSVFSITIKHSICFSGAENGANPVAEKATQSEKDLLSVVKGIGQSKKGTKRLVLIKIMRTSLSGAMWILTITIIPSD